MLTVPYETRTYTLRKKDLLDTAVDHACKLLSCFTELANSHSLQL
jgi:hypothetical protein